MAAAKLLQGQINSLHPLAVVVVDESTRGRSISLLPLASGVVDESTQGRALGHRRTLHRVQIADRHGRKGQLTTRYQGNVDVSLVREVQDAG